MDVEHPEDDLGFGAYSWKSFDAQIFQKLFFPAGPDIDQTARLGLVCRQLRQKLVGPDAHRNRNPQLLFDSVFDLLDGAGQGRIKSAAAGQIQVGLIQGGFLHVRSVLGKDTEHFF